MLQISCSVLYSLQKKYGNCFAIDKVIAIMGFSKWDFWESRALYVRGSNYYTVIAA